MSDEFALFHAQVVRTRRLGPTLQRVTLGGEELHGLVSGGRDQSFSLFLPHPGQDAPVLPPADDEAWFLEWYGMDPDVRAVMRSYTIRAHDPARAEIDVDFALHGDGGPASRWAATAVAGDRVALIGPTLADNRSVGFRLPADADWVLLCADETALPALASILSWLPADLPVRAWVTVPDSGDVTDLAAGSDVEVTWLVGSELVEAVRAADLPAGLPYAWIAGEAGAVKALRRHLVGERGVDRARVSFSGYWKRGASEDRFREMPEEAEV